VQLLDPKKVLIFLNISLTSVCHARDSLMKSWLFNVEGINKQYFEYVKTLSEPIQECAMCGHSLVIKNSLNNSKKSSSISSNVSN